MMLSDLKNIISQESVIEYKEFNIVFYLIDTCNFSCYYCYNRFPRSNKQLNCQEIIDFTSKIQQVTKMPLRITFIGGEPFCHMQLLELVNSLNMMNIQVEILTNLSAPLDKIIYALDCNAIIIASWHGGIDKKNTDFCEKIKMLPKKYFDNNQVDIRIMFENDNWENSVQAFKQLVNCCNKDIDINLLSQYSGGFYDYSQCQLDEFKQFERMIEKKKDMFKLTTINGCQQIVTFNDLYMCKNNSFYMWKCEAGKKSIYVHVNGNVFPCQSYYEHNKIPLFSISSSKAEIAKKLKFTYCSVDYCSCEYNLKKERLLTHYSK